ncbi:MAG: efflux RND transporter periplasmic adaptor subunit [Deltaproteobacteria bacterium]|nr:efflux RND transporter periplasmic adaptor subunit [Deltaproteobacteria bacterium]
MKNKDMETHRLHWAGGVVCVLLTALLLLGSCKGGGKAAEGQASAAAVTQTQGAPEKPGAGAPEAVGKRLKVEVLSIVLRPFVLQATYVGNLQPNDRVALRSEMEGLVEQVNFEESQQVARGKPLLNISTEQARVRRDLARTDFQLSDSKYKRAKDMFDKQLVPPTQFEEAQNQRDRANLALKLAEIELKKSIVEAPISGSVKSRLVSPGEFINKGQLLAEILDLSRMEAQITVPEREVAYLSAGMPVWVTLDALRQERIQGKVKSVGMEADLRSRSFPVVVIIENQGGQLRPGMLARVQVDLASFKNQVLVPRHAILEREQGPVVFVVVNDHVEERSIRTGAGTPEEVQVLQGLAVGEKMVVTGHQRLINNEVVEVVRELATDPTATSVTPSSPPITR